MANVTISIDDDLINKSRKYARMHNTSHNAMICHLIRKTVKSGSGEWLDECYSLMDKANANTYHG